LVFENSCVHQVFNILTKISIVWNLSSCLTPKILCLLDKVFDLEIALLDINLKNYCFSFNGIHEIKMFKYHIYLFI
jgi:hypothetical protein